ncbi:hypothetical protein SEUCBS140593_008760 [Sporothrix eucalyptigena]|uniref:Uncharacterized protein n=1 Tax=Sporothrix eucalyptigena TaxID=1812306 RepID=A0ABP0CQ15_9PEZI
MPAEDFLPQITMSASSESSCVSSQWPDEEMAHDPGLPSLLGDELYEYCVDTGEFPMSDETLGLFFDLSDAADGHSNRGLSPSLQIQTGTDPGSDNHDSHSDSDNLFPLSSASKSNFPLSEEEFESFFGHSTPNSCSNDSSPSPSRQVLDDDDVVFLSSRKIHESPSPHKRRRRKQRSRQSRIAKSTTRYTCTKWNDVFLHVEQAGYHRCGAGQRSESDEVFYWDRYTHSWKHRHGLHLDATVVFDLLDPKFYITVRPGGDGFPINISWNPHRMVFYGVDKMNQKTLRLDFNFVWALMSNPEESRLLKV